MAELRRNQRAEIGRRHVMAHYAAALVRFCCHLAHPDQRRNISDTPWNRDPRPLLLTKNVTGSCTSPSNWCVRMKETRPGCPPPPPLPQDSLFISSKFDGGAKWRRELIWEGRGRYWNFLKIVSILQKWLELARRGHWRERGRENLPSFLAPRWGFWVSLLNHYEILLLI